MASNFQPQNWDKRTLELIALRAGLRQTMVKKYSKKTREIFRFAAEMADCVRGERGLDDRKAYDH